jgi:hypothetical protein
LEAEFPKRCPNDEPLGADPGSAAGSIELEPGERFWIKQQRQAHWLALCWQSGSGEVRCSCSTRLIERWNLESDRLQEQSEETIRLVQRLLKS